MVSAKIGSQQRLIDAAERELITNGGFLEMASVARRAGVSVGLAYHHFGSKTGLVAAVVDRFYTGLRDIALGDAIPKDWEWTVREHARLVAITDYFYRHPLSSLIAGRLAREPEVLDMEQAHKEQLLELGARNIAQGQRRGVVSGRLDPSIAVAMLMGGHRLALEQAILAEPPTERAELVRQVWRFICQALELDDAATTDTPIESSGQGVAR